MVSLICLKVEKIDNDRMMGAIKLKFLDEHPEFKGMKITRRFMFKKLVDHALGVEY